MGRTMIADTTSRSRGTKDPSFSIKPSLFETEGAGKTGRRLAPMVRVQQKSTRQNHRFSRKTSGLPCAMVLRLIRALPGDQALLSPSSTDRSHDLTPAQGRQDHTISPSASCCSSHNTPRPSHPAPNVRDDREAPLLVSAGRADARSDLPDNARGKVAPLWHDGQFAHGTHALLS